MPEASGFGLLRMELTYQAHYARLNSKKSKPNLVGVFYI